MVRLASTRAINEEHQVRPDSSGAFCAASSDQKEESFFFYRKKIMRRILVRLRWQSW